MPPRTLEHIAYIVKDINKAKKEWAGLLGIPEPEAVLTDAEDKAHTRYHGQPSPARAYLSFLNVKPVTIELIQPLPGPSVWAEVLQKNGECFHHIAWWVEDIAAETRSLLKEGAKEVQTGDFEGGCYAYLELTTPGGLLVELLAKA